MGRRGDACPAAVVPRRTARRSRARAGQRRGSSASGRIDAAGEEVDERQPDDPGQPGDATPDGEQAESLVDVAERPAQGVEPVLGLGRDGRVDQGPAGGQGATRSVITRPASSGMKSKTPATVGPGRGSGRAGRRPGPAGRQNATPSSGQSGVPGSAGRRSAAANRNGLADPELSRPGLLDDGDPGDRPAAESPDDDQPDEPSRACSIAGHGRSGIEQRRGAASIRMRAGSVSRSR